MRAKTAKRLKREMRHKFGEDYELALLTYAFEREVSGQKVYELVNEFKRAYRAAKKLWRVQS